jgi:hypothetical protein
VALLYIVGYSCIIADQFMDAIIKATDGENEERGSSWEWWFLMMDELDKEEIDTTERDKKILRSVAIGLGVGLIVFVAYLFTSGEIYTMRLF